MEQSLHFKKLIFFRCDFIIYNEKVRKWSEFGAQGVELFYIISGFVISYSFIKNNYVIKNYLRYFFKRIIRIIPTYGLSILIALGILNVFLIFAWGSPFQFEAKKFLANLTFTCDLFPEIDWYNEVYKTLKVEFQFYIAIGLLWPLIHKNLISRGIVFGVWLVAAYFTTQHQTFIMNGPYFIIGISLCQLFFKKDLLFNWLTIAVCLGMLSSFYMMEDVIIAAIAIIMIQFVKFNSKVTDFIGKSSYSLYLLHGAFGGWFLYWFTRDDFVHLNHKLAIALAVLISLGSASIAYYIIEKPFIKLGKKIKYSKVNSKIENK